jgi:hypothetical protein
LQGTFPEVEQLPAALTYDFHTTVRLDGTPVTQVTANGTPLGDPLTDASWVQDGYRLHDVFHVSYATLLDWSPVTRALLQCKRRSSPTVDENEDGGRAIVVEEGIAAIVFAYAARRNYLRGHNHVDPALLTMIRDTVEHLEVSACGPRRWEQTILTGFTAWRQLRAAGGNGSVIANRDCRQLIFRPASQKAHLASAGPQATTRRYLNRVLTDPNYWETRATRSTRNGAPTETPGTVHAAWRRAS